MSIGVKGTIKKLFHLCGVEVTRAPHYQEYAWLALDSIHTILDIGANTGQFASQIHRILPEAMVYSFEPLQDCCEQLKKNMSGMRRFAALNFALGDTNGSSQIYRNEFAPSSSVLPMEPLHVEALPHTDSARPEPIGMRRLDDVAEELTIVDDVLVKIDVQGFEDRVILGGLSVIARARVLIVETSFRPLYQGQVLFGAIYDLLRPLGLAYMGCENMVRNPRDGTILQCDSIFVKKP